MDDFSKDGGVLKIYINDKLLLVNKSYAKYPDLSTFPETYSFHFLEHGKHGIVLNILYCKQNSCSWISEDD